MRAAAQCLAQSDMIVDLPVHGQSPTRGHVEKGLSAVLHVDDGKALVREHCALAGVNAAPVRPAVPDRLGHLERPAAHRLDRFLKSKDANEAAQGGQPFCEF